MSEKANGQIAYEAYAGATDWKSLVNGKPLPQWVDVKSDIQKAWETSAAVLLALPAPVRTSPEATDVAGNQISRLSADLAARFPAEYETIGDGVKAVDAVMNLLSELRGIRAALSQFEAGVNVGLRMYPMPDGASEAARRGYALGATARKELDSRELPELPVQFQRKGNVITFHTSETGEIREGIMAAVAAGLTAMGIKPR